MAFTYDLSTSRGKLRLKLSDTETPFVFDDDEIDYFLSDGGSVNGGVVVGAKILLANRALRVKRVKDKNKSYDDTAQVQALKDLISLYGGMPTAKISSPACLPSDADYATCS